MVDLTRDAVDGLSGFTVLEFGASWCGICQGTRPLIDSALAEHPGVRHLWVEDGPGKRLGRSFGVKLWPTLVVMRDGAEVGRTVRPRDLGALRTAFAAITAGNAPDVPSR